MGCDRVKTLIIRLFMASPRVGLFIFVLALGGSAYFKIMPSTLAPPQYGISLTYASGDSPDFHMESAIRELLEDNRFARTGSDHRGGLKLSVPGAPDVILRLVPGPLHNTFTVQLRAASPDQAASTAQLMTQLFQSRPDQPLSPADSAESGGDPAANLSLQAMKTDLQQAEQDLRSLLSKPARPAPDPDLAGLKQAASDLEDDLRRSEERYFNLLNVTAGDASSSTALRSAGFPDLAASAERVEAAQAADKVSLNAAHRDLVRHSEIFLSKQISGMRNDLANMQNRLEASSPEHANPRPASETQALRTEIARLRAEIETFEPSARATAPQDSLPRPPQPHSSASSTRAATAGSQDPGLYLVSPPSDPVPIRPRFALLDPLCMAAMAALLACLTALGWSLVRTSRSKSGLYDIAIGPEKLVWVESPSLPELRRLPPALRNLGGYVAGQPASAPAEAMRRLRSAVWGSFHRSDAPAIVSVFSVDTDENSLAVMVALSRTLALSGKRVLMVDGRAPGGGLETYLMEERLTGLTDLLSGDTNWQEAVRLDEESGAHWCAFGRSPDNGSPSSGTAFNDLLAEAAKVYDVILLNGGRFEPGDASALLISQAPTTLLAVTAEPGSLPRLLRTSKHVGSMGGRILRTVLLARTHTDAY